MGMKKRAFFFTTIAIALSIVIITSYKIYNEDRLSDKMDVVGIRIETMNNFILDLEKEIEKAIFTVGFRSLLSLEDYLMEINSIGNPPIFYGQGSVPTLDDAFSEVFQFGTINGIKMSLMENNTFLNWTNKTTLQANKTDILLKFKVDSVSVSHSSHWIVDIKVQLDIEVEDRKNTASWSINNKVYTTQINISSDISGNHRFVDPMYLVYNDGLVNNTIRKTTVPDFSSASNLETHLLNSYYIEHTDAPSYLDRFEDTNSGSYGIESLVNSQKLIDEGLSINDRSAVDYIYFGTAVTTNCIVDEPEYIWFKLDLPPTDHLTSPYNSICDDD